MSTVVTNIYDTLILARKAETASQTEGMDDYVLHTEFFNLESSEDLDGLAEAYATDIAAMSSLQLITALGHSTASESQQRPERAE